MSVMEVARIRGKPGTGDELAAALERALKSQAADPECLEVFFQRGVEDPDEFLLDLAWTSVEAHDAWRSEHRAEFIAPIEALIAERPQLLGHYRFVAQVKGP
jgi:quinol monooxygenase YgiN